MIVTSENYVELAMRTDNKYGPDVRGRLRNPALIKSLHHLMKLTSSIGELADMDKRFIFYGSPIYQGLHSPVDKHLAKFDSEVLFDRVTEMNFMRLLHSTIGLMTEIGELVDILYAYLFEGKDIDFEHIKEEYGDKFWYLALGLDVLKLPMGQVLLANISKLAARYPEGYTHADALNRDLDAERVALNRDYLNTKNGLPLDVRSFLIEVGISEPTEQQIELLKDRFMNAVLQQPANAVVQVLDFEREEQCQSYTVDNAISELKDTLSMCLPIEQHRKNDQMCKWLEELKSLRPVEGVSC